MNHWCRKQYLKILKFTMMLSNHDVIRILVNIALFKQLILASWCIVYSIRNINIHIDDSLHENAYSERRNSSDARSHVLRFDFTSYLKSIRVSNLDSFVSAIFTSMYDLVLQDLRHRKSLFESFRQRIAERVASLKKSHCWKSFRIHRWESLHESFRLNSLKYWAESTDECCEKMLKNTVFAKK